MKTLFDTKELLNEFDINLIGIDEAGRGALAGPMMMAACKLNKQLDGLCDSKKTKRKKNAKNFMKSSSKIQTISYLLFLQNKSTH
ncbi:hypothetical protein OLU60_07040 [Campylobacter jejuni]|nr:hypothetical protein [Campylobacter jejuni]MCW1593619.1 hypothetical protein [Campylobacter jejuni]MCW1701574.1 hypothetical protein [Campylobacter jejuni]